MIKLKFVIFLIISILMGVNSYSQEFTGGLQLGLNGSQIDGDALGGYNHPALLFGGFVELKIKKQFHIELGLKYAGKGATQSLKTVPTGYFPTKVRLKYIEIPIIASQRFLQKYDVQIGVLSNYLFSTKATDENGNVVPSETYDFSKFDFMAMAGVEVPYKTNFKLGMYFSNSIWFISDYPLLRNRVITLGIKYYPKKRF